MAATILCAGSGGRQGWRDDQARAIIQSERDGPVPSVSRSPDLMGAKRSDLYRRVFESLPIGIKIWCLEDPNDPGSLRLVASNEAAAAATGVPVARVLGKTIREAFPEAVPKGIAAAFAEVARSGQSKSLGEVLYGDTRVNEGFFSVFAFSLPGNCVGVAFENVTAQKMGALARERREVLTRLQVSLLMLVNEATGVDQALRGAVKEICEYTRWPVGHAYAVQRPGAERLVSTGIWYLTDPARYEAFRRASADLAFERGKGLPGRVWAAKGAAWIVDVEADLNFPRVAVGREVGLKAGFGFPVMLDGEVVAVLEFFTPESRLPDQDLLEVMESVGRELGFVVGRDPGWATVP